MNKIIVQYQWNSNLPFKLDINASFVKQLSNVIVDGLVSTFQSIKDSTKTLASTFFVFCVWAWHINKPNQNKIINMHYK